MNYRSRLRLFCLLALLLVGSAANAQSVPDIIVSAGVDLNIGFQGAGHQSRFTLGGVALNDSDLGNVEASVFGAPFPLLSARTRVGPNALLANIKGNSASTLQYYFQINGPTGLVPVDISASGLATAAVVSGGNFDVVAGWQLRDSLIGVPTGPTLAGGEVRSGLSLGGFDQSFISSDEVPLATNHVYCLIMFARATVTAVVPGSDGLAQAFVDPTLSFGPGVDSSVYSFTFSNGIGNTPAASAAAPEPAPLFLLTLGLLGFCTMRRRRFDHASGQ